MPLLLVLFSQNAPEAIADEGKDAEWHVATLDLNYKVLSDAVFTTQRSFEMTLDTIDTSLDLKHGLVFAQVTYGIGCGGNKWDQRFDVPLAISSTPSCVVPGNAEYPPTSYPDWRTTANGGTAPPAACTPEPVTPEAVAPLQTYEASQAQTISWRLMPYVEEAAQRLDIDSQRIAYTLAPPQAETSSSARPKAAPRVAVGSLLHTTERWSFVKGDALRVYQLLPVHDRGIDGFVVVYSRASPDALLS